MDGIARLHRGGRFGDVGQSLDPAGPDRGPGFEIHIGLLVGSPVDAKALDD
jgi:hypothetical protein